MNSLMIIGFIVVSAALWFLGICWAINALNYRPKTVGQKLHDMTCNKKSHINCYAYNPDQPICNDKDCSKGPEDCLHMIKTVAIIKDKEPSRLKQVRVDKNGKVLIPDIPFMYKPTEYISEEQRKRLEKHKEEWENNPDKIKKESWERDPFTSPQPTPEQYDQMKKNADKMEELLHGTKPQPTDLFSSEPQRPQQPSQVINEFSPLKTKRKRKKKPAQEA